MQKQTHQKPFTIQNKTYQNMTYADLPTRFIAFLGDLAGMLFAMYLWDLVMLLVLAGTIPLKTYYDTSSIIYMALLGSLFLFNTGCALLLKEASCGKYAMELQVVSNKNRKLLPRFIIMRNIIGFSIPILIAYLLFSFMGVIIYFLLNVIIVIVDPLHRSIIDFALQTKVVKKIDTNPIEERQVKKVVQETIIKPRNNSPFDLHVYSSYSHDGSVNVEDLLTQAKQLGITTLSICDHNCVKANKAAKRLAPLYGITYIAGITIDCQYKGEHIRLLGYGIEGNDDRFLRLENENLAKEKATSLQRIALLEKHLNIKVDVDYLLSKSRFHVVSQEELARYVLSEEVYQTHPLIAPYIKGAKSGQSITNFIRDFFGEKGAAYTKVIYPDAMDMIALIHASEGKAIVAHPIHSLRYNQSVLVTLLNENINGVELFTPYHNAQDVEQLLNLCKGKKIIVTAGSEYHGTQKPNFHLGETGCPKEAQQAIEQTINKLVK